MIILELMKCIMCFICWEESLWGQHLMIWSLYRSFLTSHSMHSLPSLLLLFSHSVTSDSLWPHGLQYTSLLCPSLSLRICSNSCPLSWWCHPTISSSFAPFSSCPQSFPASGSFPISLSSHQVAKLLELQLQHQSFQWIFKDDFL